jgi:hypothetical protein
MVGLEPARFLDVDWLLAQFAADRATAQRRYLEFVEGPLTEAA